MDIYDGIGLLTLNWKVVLERVESTPYLSPSEIVFTNTQTFMVGICLWVLNLEVVLERVESTPYPSPSELCSQIHRHL